MKTESTVKNATFDARAGFADPQARSRSRTGSLAPARRAGMMNAPNGGQRGQKPAAFLAGGGEEGVDVALSSRELILGLRSGSSFETPR